MIIEHKQGNKYDRTGTDTRNSSTASISTPATARTRKTASSMKKSSRQLRSSSSSSSSSSNWIVTLVVLLLTNFWYEQHNQLLSCCVAQNQNSGGDYDNYDEGSGGDYYYGGGSDGSASDGYYGSMDDADNYYTSSYGTDGTAEMDIDTGAGGSADNLYADYAEHQQSKMMANTAPGGGIGYVKLAVACGVSWFAGGKYHSQRTSKKLKLKFQKEQKQLYTQYYNDVYKLSETNNELNKYVDTLKDALKQTEQKHELEAIQRDYDEFKQPDIDGDDRISRAEFNMYVKNYLSNYPGLTEADYPKFEDFDHDKDGYVSFQEYAQQMALQAQQAELEQMYGNTKDTTSTTKNKSDKKKQQLPMDGLFDSPTSQPSSVGSARTKMYR